MPYIFRLIISAALLGVLVSSASADETADRNAQTILHMLDYVSVDYGGSVLYGKVLNEREYAEQSEFANQAAMLINKLPEHPRQTMLITKAVEIANYVKEKAPADHVRQLALQLRNLVIETYHVPVSPRALPETLPALALYQKLCVPCHGPDGHGDGPLSKMITPKPANFHDSERMGQRSVHGLYSSITLGVPRTSMVEFSQLSDEDRWSLAFLVSNFRFTSEELELGRKLWESRSYQGPTPDLAALTVLTGNEISARYGDETRAVYRFLLSKPDALLATPHATLIFATEQLDAAVENYHNGNQIAAQRLAIAAYLEGFEPMEISLDNLDKQLRQSIESEMLSTRQLISSSAPVETIRDKVAQTKTLLKLADERFREGRLSIKGAFLSALSILLREAFAGTLILIILITFLIKTNQRENLRYVHFGWVSAAMLGILTWVISNSWTEISGIIRETTSGVTALIASAMTAILGLWLYNRARNQSLQNILPGQITAPLKRITPWALLLLAFFSIYRATAESAMFYEALWTQAAFETQSVIWSGLMMGALLLLTMSWSAIQLGLSLSNKTLFNYMSFALALLAAIFSGQGITSLQRAGYIGVSKIDFISLPLLGINPSTQSLLAGLIMVGILLVCYKISARQR